MYSRLYGWPASVHVRLQAALYFVGMSSCEAAVGQMPDESQAGRQVHIRLAYTEPILAVYGPNKPNIPLSEASTPEWFRVKIVAGGWCLHCSKKRSMRLPCYGSLCDANSLFSCFF